ncbi:shikimate kinase [Bacillus sp. 165]|uniref:shikimate kinase n=1 Tax=Bacillus sp. 165 TaxID=1529117 RepID=UPI001ADA759D|nr:shikimate kinase [Bacillus sp. 165]MBO9129671.1 shikimate kinase [Bacillus sp. 165]
MQPIYITGFMGAGKTTVGKALSAQWQVPVIDTDKYLEQKLQKKIVDIFQEEGEEQFRLYESTILHSLPTQDVIITTGGGTVIKEENRKWMKEHGIVIYLYCDPAVITKRLQHDNTRPLFNQDDIDSFITLFHTRQSFYEDAHFSIDTTNKQPAEVIDEIEKKFKI